MNARIVVITFGAILAFSTAHSQTTAETKTAPDPYKYETKVGRTPVTVAPSTTTTYTQPGSGPTGNPIPGNQRGSSHQTSLGATVTIPLPEGKKNK